MKKILIAITAVILIAVIVFIIFYPRIEKETLNFLARRILPPGSDFREITFDKQNKQILITGFTLRNIPGFSAKNILEIERIMIKIAGKLYGEDSIRPEEVLLDGASLFLERNKEGKFNIEYSDSYMKSSAPEEPKTEKPEEAVAEKQMILPAEITLRNSNLYFLDSFPKEEKRELGIYQTDIVMKILDRKAKPSLAPINAEGTARLNKNKSGRLKFKMQAHYPGGNMHFDSSYIISDYDLKEIIPYLNERIPFHIKKGIANGNIVFTYNGTERTIGSNNTFEFFDLDYSIKSGMENAQFIETTAATLSKYMVSQRGGIIFDFKVKGPVDDPRFYLGPLTKRGVAMAVIDTVGSQILKTPTDQLKQFNVPDFFEQFMEIIGK